MQQIWSENENRKNDENVNENHANENFDCKIENFDENFECNEM